eukprot:2625363-Pyramimonas_sp.AAC.1
MAMREVAGTIRRMVIRGRRTSIRSRREAANRIRRRKTGGMRTRGGLMRSERESLSAPRGGIY